jgi:glycosyltransferase involved in cell wall biosynthesis
VRLDRAAILASRLLSLGSPPLYVHFAHKPATIGRFASLLAGVPYALSCHAKDIWLTPPDELGAKLRDAQTALVCTATGRRELERHAAGATPVRLVYHGVDLSAASASRVADGGHRILTVGRLVEKKGHDTLIRAAALLRDRGVPFTLRIVGEGVDWARLQRLVHQLDLGERVVFLGPLTAEEVQEEYATCAVFALASRVLPSGDRDGLPNVVLEAMVRGLPVVATTLTGVAEAVEQEQSGLLVAPDDPAALAGALARVLGDGALAERLGRGARERVHEKFDCNRTLPGVAEALAAAGLIGVGAAPGSRAADERETLAAA